MERKEIVSALQRVGIEQAVVAFLALEDQTPRAELFAPGKPSRSLTGDKVVGLHSAALDTVGKPVSKQPLVFLFGPCTLGTVHQLSHGVHHRWEGWFGNPYATPDLAGKLGAVLQPYQSRLLVTTLQRTGKIIKHPGQATRLIQFLTSHPVARA